LRERRTTLSPWRAFSDNSDQASFSEEAKEVLRNYSWRVMRGTAQRVTEPGSHARYEILADDWAASTARTVSPRTAGLRLDGSNGSYRGSPPQNQRTHQQAADLLGFRVRPQPQTEALRLGREWRSKYAYDRTLGSDRRTEPREEASGSTAGQSDVLAGPLPAACLTLLPGFRARHAADLLGSTRDFEFNGRSGLACVVGRELWMAAETGFRILP